MSSPAIASPTPAVKAWPKPVIAVRSITIPISVIRGITVISVIGIRRIINGTTIQCEHDPNKSDC
jgi:hypothetical protein